MHRRSNRALRRAGDRQGTVALAGGVLVALAVAPLAFGFGEGDPVDGGVRNPSGNAELAYIGETEIIADSTTYGTRQSNKRIGDGGGAIYGCRSIPGREPCLRANNLNTGRAFEFSSGGKEGGLIELKDPTGAPLTTNATGVATGFNADKVDGKDAATFAGAADLLFARVDVDAGTLLAGGRSATAAALEDENANTFSVAFSREVAACSFTATHATAAADAALAIVAVPHATDKRIVLVDQQDDEGVGGVTETAVDFHLQVIC